MGTIVGLNKLFNRKCNNSVSVHLSLYWYNDYKLHTYISTAIYIYLNGHIMNPFIIKGWNYTWIHKEINQHGSTGSTVCSTATAWKKSAVEQKMLKRFPCFGEHVGKL